LITSDFEDQVKAHLEPAWAAVFRQDRGPYGRCMAKTMIKGDGRQVVVADVHLFLKDAPSPEPILRHEALHALIHLRSPMAIEAGWVRSIVTRGRSVASAVAFCRPRYYGPWGNGSEGTISSSSAEGAPDHQRACA